jgi:hypothetical protein
MPDRTTEAPLDAALRFLGDAHRDATSGVDA